MGLDFFNARKDTAHSPGWLKLTKKKLISIFHYPPIVK